MHVLLALEAWEELSWFDSSCHWHKPFLHWIYKSQESEPQCNRSWPPTTLLLVTDLSTDEVFCKATLEIRAPFSLVLVLRGKWLKCPVEEIGWSFTLQVHISLDQSLLGHFLLHPAFYTFLKLLGLLCSLIATKPAHNKLKEKADSKETFPQEMSHLLIPQV